MPLYVCYCPDYPAPKGLENRLKVRDAHLAAAGEDKKQGKSVFGRAFISESVSTTSDGTHPDQLSGMAGSVMILRQPTLQAAWDRIKADKYWTGDVWDKEKVTVNELIGAPVDETIKIQ